MSEDDSRADAEGNGLRGQGILFWLLLACAVLAVFFNARSGELLRAGVVSALGLYLIIDRLAPWERSTVWRWIRGASVGIFCLMTLILVIRGLW